MKFSIYIMNVQCARFWRKPKEHVNAVSVPWLHMCLKISM